MALEILPRPCDRCGTGNFEDISEFSDTEMQTPMCAEFMMAYGVVAWLCLDCRIAWYKEIENLEVANEYRRVQFSLDFWNNKVSAASTEEDLQIGLALLEKIMKIEADINAHAHKWIITN